MPNDMYNPNGASFHNKLPMKKMDKFNQLDDMEDVFRYRTEYTLGTYYPPRCTPSVAINLDSELPWVFAAGDIIAIKDIKSAYAYDAIDTDTGILTSGDVAVSQQIDTGAVMKKSLEFLYPKDMSGFIVKANGGVQATDTYSTNDVTYGVLTLSGTTPTAGVTTYVRSANKPAGIVGSRVAADLKYRWLNYDVVTHGTSIIPAGVITLPVVFVTGSGTLSTVVTAVKAALDPTHQYILLSGVTEATVVAKAANGTKLMSDTKGKFVEYSGSDTDQLFGRILEKRVRVPYDMSPYDESFPGSSIKGTDTAGLSKRLYTLMNSALVAAGVTGTSKETLKTYLYSSVATTTSNVKIGFSNVDVAFGYLAK